MSAKILALFLALIVGFAFTFTISTDDVSATTFSTLKKVTSVKVSSTTYNSVTLKWSKMSGAKGYQIYCATSKNGT